MPGRVWPSMPGRVWSSMLKGLYPWRRNVTPTVTVSEGADGKQVGFVRGVLDWLERIFFAGVELSVLGTPGYLAVFLLQNQHPDAIPMAGLTALAVGCLSIAVFRHRTIDVGKWPRRGELSSAPLRVVYFSTLFFLASWGVGTAAMAIGSYWYTLGGGVAIALGMAAFPTVYRLIHGDPATKPAEMI